MTYNPNIDYIMITSIIFEQKAVGIIYPRVLVNYMQADIYTGPRIARVIVEILYIAMVVYYMKAEITQWLRK